MYIFGDYVWKFTLRKESSWLTTKIQEMHFLYTDTRKHGFPAVWNLRALGHSADQDAWQSE